MNFRNKNLIDLAKGRECFILSPECVGGTDTTVSCHSNAQRHGHGTSIKSHDCFSAPGCAGCNHYLDQSGVPREVKELMFRNAFERWLVFLWSSGLIQVAGARFRREPKTTISKVMPRRHV